MAATLTPPQAKPFYDRLGAKQDWQGFYENAALRRLIAHAAFERAYSVVEFGCGTGRLTAALLARHLPAEARYLGLDISDSMVGLARAHLEGWRDRAEVQRTEGAVTLPLAEGAPTASSRPTCWIS